MKVMIEKKQGRGSLICYFGFELEIQFLDFIVMLATMICGTSVHSNNS